MNFKRFMVISGVLILAIVVGLFWGCEKVAPTAPQTGVSLVSYKTRAAVGFGASATGGSGGTTVTVSNASSFLDYIGRSGSYIIRVNGTISLSGMNDVASSKTIEGVGTSGKITGGGLDIDGVSNVIIRNIAFSNWDDDAINVQDGSTNIWIDHCEFSNGYDGCVDIKRGSDYITVSWNHFYNHEKTCLLGHSDDNGSQDIGHLRVTYHHNYFDGTDTRHPRVRFSALCHVYNNYYRNNEYGIASTCDGEVLVENNYFENCDDPTLVGYASSPEGDLVERGNVYSNCENGPETRGSVPSPSYSYSLDNASSIPSIVSSGAGLDGGGGGSTTTTTTTSGGSTTTTTSGGGSNSIVVRARGTGGGEHIYVTVGGSQIGNFNLTTSYQNYSASTNNTGDINVCFDNDDGENMDVQIDYITVNGSTRQAEDQSSNTGVWQDGSCGGSNSEWLHCEGCIGFGSVSGGGTTTTTTSGGSTTTTTAAATTTTTTSGGGSNSIVVRARGTGGGEHIYVTVGGSQIGNFNLTTSYQNYSASTNNTGDINVCFDNDDGENMDVQIDYITVNGSTRQAEDQSSNTGVWQDGSCGGSNSEWLHCEGCIGFGSVSGGGTTTTTTSGGSTTTTTAAATTTTGGGSNSIVVRARGTGGGEHIYVTVGGSQIGNFNLTTSYQNYSASTNNTGDINVCFDNDDGENMDVQIDYITVNGSTRQAEDQSYNTGVWQNNECGGGDGMSEWLHCEGCIGFGSVSGGGTTTTTTSGGSTTTTTAAATTTTTSGGGGTKYITSTIRVNGGTYDGGGERIIAQGMGDGSQDEDQDPIFRLENATVKNVRIAAPGCDGIHCYGNCRVENVTWEDVGEDALTVKGEGTVTVSGGSARDASDKVFQLNQPCTFTVENFSATNFGCFIRQNGGTSFKCTIYVNNVTLSNGDYGVRTDATTTQIYYRNLNASNVDNLWRVPNQSSQVHTY